MISERTQAALAARKAQGASLATGVMQSRQRRSGEAKARHGDLGACLSAKPGVDWTLAASRVSGRAQNVPREGKPVGLRPEPEKDGSHIMTVETPDGEPIDIVFSEYDAVEFVRILQSGFVNRMGPRQVTPGFPALRLIDVDIAHAADDTGLLVRRKTDG